MEPRPPDQGLCDDQFTALRISIIRVLRQNMEQFSAVPLGIERTLVPLADAILDTLREAHGGQSIYIPTGAQRDRHARILVARAAGCPVPEICAQLGVSRATVYRVIGARTRRVQ